MATLHSSSDKEIRMQEKNRNKLGKQFSIVQTEL